METRAPQVGPEISPEQAARVLRILGEWTRRGFWYSGSESSCPTSRRGIVDYDDPSILTPGCELRSEGIDHFDALCQATTVMQVLLEEDQERLVTSTE